MKWTNEFRDRLKDFTTRFPPRPNEIAVSIKIRPQSGCFHREHSPRAYEMIDAAIAKKRIHRTALVEHETGPELLTLIPIAAAGISISAAVINLVAAIIKARAEGAKKGDHSHAPSHVIVRTIRTDGPYREEDVIQVECTTPVTEIEIEEALTSGIMKLADRTRSSAANKLRTLADRGCEP